MKTQRTPRVLKVRIAVKKRSALSAGFGAELKKLIELKQRMPLHFVG